MHRKQLLPRVCALVIVKKEEGKEKVDFRGSRKERHCQSSLKIAHNARKEMDVNHF